MHRLAPDTGSTFPQRLSYYLLGIALGLVILGMFQMQRRMAADSQATTSEAGAEVQPAPAE